MSNPSPTNITADRQTRRFTVNWNDNHVSTYTFTFLRLACPCAECKGGHERMGTLPDLDLYDRPDEDTPATRLTQVEAVGSYGLTIHWEDGHQYGIYNWHYLRAICPCPLCRPDRMRG
jgi:DUF971 family protein